MNQRAQTTLDLGRLALSPGEGRRLEISARPGDFELGGEHYRPDQEGVPARLDVSRTASGHAMRLRFGVTVQGPCVRCLVGSDVLVEVDAREIHQPGSGDEELESPYVDDEILDLGGWAHDAVALAMPERFLCRDDCAGLCPVCGESLNETDPAEHRHEQGPDPRWAKLRELKLD